MLPTRDQIERAAYDRWIRRHRAHGHDRHDWLGAENELTYLLNYQTIAVTRSTHRAGRSRLARIACRFCERHAVVRDVLHAAAGRARSCPGNAFVRADL